MIRFSRGAAPVNRPSPERAWTRRDDEGKDDDGLLVAVEPQRKDGEGQGGVVVDYADYRYSATNEIYCLLYCSNL